jgi:isocitrate/isopropylmalate dehydrogenase
MVQHRKGIANPTSLILSVAMMLTWLGERRRNSTLLEAASAIETAIDHCLSAPGSRTRDLGGALGTSEFAKAVVDVIES